MRKEYDFSESKRGAIVKTAKERITIRLDPDIIQWFRDRVKGGGNYLSLSNSLIRKFLTLRDTRKSQSLPGLSDSFWISDESFCGHCRLDFAADALIQ